MIWDLLELPLQFWFTLGWPDAPDHSLPFLGDLEKWTREHVIRAFLENHQRISNRAVSQRYEPQAGQRHQSAQLFDQGSELEEFQKFFSI
jgi:hypothetical protein